MPYSLIGWSEGARTSLHLAHEQRAHVRKVVLLGAGVVFDARGVQTFKSKSYTSRVHTPFYTLRCARRDQLAGGEPAGIRRFVRIGILANTMGGRLRFGGTVGE
jgi:pimeloyl-ACP methyl ester carboxylesterase